MLLRWYVKIPKHLRLFHRKVPLYKSHPEITMNQGVWPSHWEAREIGCVSTEMAGFHWISMGILKGQIFQRSPITTYNHLSPAITYQMLMSSEEMFSVFVTAGSRPQLSQSEPFSKAWLWGEMLQEPSRIPENSLGPTHRLMFLDRHQLAILKKAPKVLPMLSSDVWQSYTGWWFGTFIFDFSHSVGNSHHPNWRFLIFFRGVG